jgi:metal-responsive CopG/Arc/MetJ family transcriptional regulator
VLNPEGPTKVVAASVPESLVADLDALAERKGWGRSQAVTEAIRGLLKPSRPRG